LEKELLSLLLPSGLVELFELEKVETLPDGYHLYLFQKNIPPNDLEGHKLESKGFFESITIRDFPLRGRACFLHLRRRKWLNHDTGQIVFHEWDEVAKGTRMTKEFATFLKDIGRQLPG
jgi:hypothetical protein